MAGINNLIMRRMMIMCKRTARKRKKRIKVMENFIEIFENGKKRKKTKTNNRRTYE